MIQTHEKGEIYFKELTHLIEEVGKAKISRVSQQVGDLKR